MQTKGETRFVCANKREKVPNDRLHQSLNYKIGGKVLAFPPLQSRLKDRFEVLSHGGFATQAS